MKSTFEDDRPSQPGDRRRTVLWLGAGLLLAGALLFGADWEADRQERQRLDAFRAQTADLARISEAIVDGKLRSLDDALLVLREELAADPAHFGEHLRRVRSGPLADRELLVLLVGRDGYLAHTDTPGAPNRVYLGDRKYFRFFADGGKDSLYIDEPSLGRVTGRYILPVVRPRYDRRGAFAGVIAISLPQQTLVNFIPRLHLSGETTIAIVNHAGAMVSQAGNPAEAQGKTLPPELLARLLQGTEGVFSSPATPGRVERIIAYRHVHFARTPLIVTVESLPGQLLAETSLQRSILTGGAGFTSLVVMVLISLYLKGRRTTTRLIDTLRTSKKLEYETLTRTSLDGFLIADEAGRFLDTNDTLGALLGYTSAELLRLGIADLEALESPDQAAAHLRTVIEAGSDRFQSRWRRKDGTIIDVEISVQHLKEDGRLFVFVRDITERKQAAEALRESEEKYRSLFENASAGIFHSLPEGRFLRVNPALASMLRYASPEEMVAAVTNINTQIYIDAKKRTDLLAVTMSREGWVFAENRYRRKDGTIMVANLNVRRVLNADGTLAYLEGFIEDITERKESEEALRRSEELLNETGRLARIGGWEIDLGTGALTWTRETYEIHEVGPGFVPTVEAAVGFYAPESRPLIRRAVDAAVARGEAFDLKLEVVTATGRRIWVQAIGRAHVSDGVTRTVSGTLQDITLRKQAEEDLLRSERLLAETERIGKVGGWEVNIDTGKQTWTEEIYRIHEVDPAFEPTVENGLGFYAPSSRAIIEESVRRAVEQGEPFDVELEIITAKGKHRSVHAIGRADLEHRRLHGFFQDVTERSRLAAEKGRLEDQLRQSQKVEAIGRLAGGVAHDFNNLTAIILGYGGMLVEQLPPGDPRRRHAEQIVTAGQRSAALTRQLLAFSRQQTLQPEVLDLNVLLANFKQLLGRLIGEDVELKFRLTADPGRIKADPGQIEQVITNLALNARDAMPLGGQLTIETADLELDEVLASRTPGLVPGSYVMLALTDTGCGMDEAAMARLFEPFFTTKPKGKGTGLGLATVYGIVKQSGGYVRASSRLGLGTTFTIYLPRTEAAAESKTDAHREEAPRGGGELVLLVEDEASLRELCETILARLGYRVSAVGDGLEALALAREQHLEPDLVITDVIMPGMSGAEMAERLRRERPGLKVLFMSGYPDEALAPHGVLDPGTPFIQKPFSERALAAKVRETLDGNAAVAPPGRRILMIDDDEQCRDLTGHFCTKAGFLFEGVASEAAALAALAGGSFDVLLVDLNIPGTDGERVLRAIRAAGHTAPAIVLTGDVALADMAALRPLGVARALEKSSRAAPLLRALDETIEEAGR